MRQGKIASVITLLIFLVLPPCLASSRALPSSAKPRMGKIMGTLLDANDARVAHAKVRIESSKFRWEGISDDAGDFTAAVPTGTYRIYVEAHGFRKFESAFLSVKPKVIEMVNIHLEVQPIINTIPVSPQKQI
jgi:hypothetical protein